MYLSCPKHTKLLVAKAIVQAVQNQDPPGRFIKLKDNQTQIWEPITYAQAVNKTSQALREKDPAGRKSKTANQQQQLRQPQQPQQNLREELDQRKNLEIARDAAKRVKFDGAQISESIANLTNVTIESAESLETMKKGKPQRVQPHKRKNISGVETERSPDSTIQTTQRAAKKPKIADSTFVKPSWWGMVPLIKRVHTVRNTAFDDSNSIEVPGAIVTPGIEENSDFEGGKRMRILSGEENADTNERGDYQVKNMGLGVVNQVGMPAQTETEAAPFPIETSLISRQSSMFRFLSKTGILDRGTSTVMAPPQLGRANSTLATDPAPFLDIDQNSSWPQQKESGMIRDEQCQEEQGPSLPPFSSGHNMGKMIVEQLRSRQLDKNPSLNASGTEIREVANDIAVVEHEMDDVPMSGLMNVDDASPPPPKGMKTQMSDWLTSIFPSASKDDGSILVENYNRAPTSNYYRSVLNPSSRDIIDNSDAAMPPPPGGGADLGRSASSTIFGLVGSPSLFLTTLKSGVSSLFGDSLFSQQEDAMSTPIRRFPSSFQQQQQQQQQKQNIVQRPFLGNISAGGPMGGKQPVLGEKAKRKDSLLDDVEESDDVKELRNVKPVGLTRGSRFY